MDSVERAPSASGAVREWARQTLKNGINYNFERYADYLVTGTLRPLVTDSISVVPPPQGTYAEKFSRVMALTRQATPEAIGEMVAALGDPNEHIRLLADLTLGNLKDERVVEAVRAFLKRTQSAEGRAAAERFLAQHDGR